MPAWPTERIQTGSAPQRRRATVAGRRSSARAGPCLWRRLPRGTEPNHHPPNAGGIGSSGLVIGHCTCKTGAECEPIFAGDTGLQFGENRPQYGILQHTPPRCYATACASGGRFAGDGVYCGSLTCAAFATEGGAARISCFVKGRCAQGDRRNTVAFWLGSHTGRVS